MQSNVNYSSYPKPQNKHEISKYPIYLSVNILSIYLSIYLTLIGLGAVAGVTAGGAGASATAFSMSS